MTYKKEIRRMRWFAAMLMLVAAMVVPTMAWAQDSAGDDSNGYDSNGFASDGSYQPAIPTETDDIDGDGNKDIVYEISNAGQLYWFAGLVNGDEKVCTGGVTQNTAANAVLTDNITVNTGVLDSNGNIASDVRGFRNWTPIGSNYNNRYTGTFDGNGNTISGLYFDNSSTYNVGLFGYISGGTIKNVGIVDSYFNGREDVGGLCGNNQGTISDCYFFGSVNGNNFVAGLCGEMYNGSLSSCYFVGTVSGSSNTGAVCGYNDGFTITDSFFNSDIYTGVAVGKNDRGTTTNVVGKTTAQFKSGEVAYQLNGDRDVWGQTINTNDFPIFGGSKVYATTGCVSYSNEPTHTGDVAHDFTHSTDGRCSNCGNYEEPLKNENDVYQIDTFSKLYWFANQVNSGTRDINAVLTADITVNTSVLKQDGTLADDTNGFIVWTPIGNSTFPYIGNFDGQQHTISGLYYNDNTADNVGLFGYIGGVMNNGYIPCGSIKNVSIADSYFCGKDYVGGICGKSETNPINKCSNSGTVNGQNFVGGVCGINKYGLVIECSNIGMVNGNDQVGGLCGGNYYDSGTIQIHGYESGVIRNCSNTGKVSGNTAVGGVCGNNAATLDGCSNSGVINGIRNYIGGVCGQSSKSGSIGGEINNSHNTGTVTGKGNSIGGVCGKGIDDVIKNCYNTGDVTGINGDGESGKYVGGICGLGSSVHIYSSYNTGAVSGIDNVGGIGGSGQISGYNCYNTGAISGNNYVGGLGGNSDYFYNCFSIGMVSGESNVGGINGGNIVQIINCYYDSDKFTGAALGDLSQYYINVCGKTTAQFKSGEVAYLLDALSDTYNSNDTGIDWGQTIGVEYFPVLGGQRVYATKGCTTYSNVESATENEHSFGNGDVCTVCGSYRPATPDANGIYQIGSVDDLYWFAQQVNSGNTEISAVLTADITINEGVLKADGTLTDNPIGLKQWQPIAYYGRKAASGTFDGNGHTISGLYVNDPIRSCVGLFANLSDNATVKNLIIKDSYISGYGSVGGVCGFSCGTIANCGFIGAVSGNTDVGGVCGFSYFGKITNSYFNGTVSGNDNVGGVYGLYDEASTITNCYYLASEDDNKGGKTAAQFKSGEVAWLLNGSKSEGTADAPLVWYQNISGESVDKYPVLNKSHQVVEACYITLPESTPHGSVKVSNMDGEELTPGADNKLFAAKSLQVKIEAIPDESESVVYKVKSFKVMAGENEITSNDPFAITEEVTVTAEFELDWIVVSGIKYQVLANKSNEVAALGNTGSSTALTIPASVSSPDNNEQSYAVTQIADNAFANDAAITSVAIPASIVSIGAKAFSRCSSLKEIIFTGTVPPATIGEGAFSGIHADALITVPALSVDAYKTALGEALASKIIADKGVITLIHNQGGKINVYVVNGDTETLQTHTDGKVLVDWGTQVKIEAKADEGYVFDWLKINNESLDVNTYTVRIMRYSPSTVSGQGENFGDITAEASFSVKIATSSGGGNESVTIKGSIDTTGDTQTIIVTHCDKGTESATIPDYAESIGVNIPVTSIAASAFEGCSSLKTVEIPSSITTIGSNAFKGCTSLEKFKIRKVTTAMPSTSATRAAARAAADDVEVPEVDEHAFDDIVDKATLYVPEGWKEAFKTYAVWSRFSKIKEYRDDENETVLAELTLTASAGGSLTVGAVTSENNTQTVKVAEDSEVTVTITPAEGYILSSLLYGGQDVTAQVVGGTLTLTSLEGENTLAAVFGVDTGIGAVYDMSKTVYVRDGSIIVDGAAVGEVVIVCDAAGRVLRREVANGEPIELPMAAGKVYIVRIGKQVIKLTM